MKIRSGHVRHRAQILGLAVLCAAPLAAFAAQSSGFRVIQKIPIPGPGRGDYLTVDEGARRLYVSHGNQVDVLDTDSKTVIGTISNTPGVHGIAMAPEIDRGFITNGKSGTVTIFAAKSLKTLSEVKAGTKPDAIAYDPATSRVFAFNGGDGTATAISSGEGKSVGTIELGGTPEFAIADGRGSVFNNLEDKDLVLGINSRTLKVERRWPTAPCKAPSSMAMDGANRRLFVGCRSRVMVVLDADSGKVVATVPIGDHVDATVYDATSRFIFNANGEGSITVVRQESPNLYSVTDTIKTVPGAKTIALDTTTHQLFLSATEGTQFEVLVVGK